MWTAPNTALQLRLKAGARHERTLDEKVPARTPQNTLEDAPGSYVMLRLGKPSSGSR